MEAEERLRQTKLRILSSPEREGGEGKDDGALKIYIQSQGQFNSDFQSYPWNS